MFMESERHFVVRIFRRMNILSNGHCVTLTFGRIDLNERCSTCDPWTLGGLQVRIIFNAKYKFVQKRRCVFLYAKIVYDPHVF